MELVFDPATFSGDRGRQNKWFSRVFDVKAERIIAKVLSLQPDLVAFSVHSANYRWALKIAGGIKEKLEVPTIFGGIHASSVPERVIREKVVDAVVVGEGELPLLELVESLSQGSFTNYTIKNVYFKRDGAIVPNSPRPYIKDLDQLPFPDKDLFYQKVPSLERIYLIMTSRGCPYRCTYCCNNIFFQIYAEEKKHYRRRRVENVIAELKRYKKRGKMTYVAFWDDIFALDLKWLQEFSPRYRDEIGLPFVCYVHPRLVNEQMLQLLVSAGCDHIKMGIQSVSETTGQKVLRRQYSLKDVERSAALIKKYRIRLTVEHILALPFEGEKEQLEAAKLYSRIRPNKIVSFWLTYYPRTEIITHGKKAGLITEEEIERIEDGFNSETYMYPRGKLTPERRIFSRFQILFDLIPLLPQRISRWIISKKAYRYFLYHSILHQFLLVLKATVYHDREILRAIQYVFASKKTP